MMLRVFILIFALAAGGLAAWIVISRMGSPDVPVAVAVVAPAQTQVLVAATDLPAGATLVAESLRWQDWPVAALNPGFITRATRPDAAAELVTMVIRTSLLAGEPVHDGRLLGAGSGYLSVLLPSGMRAVAVSITAENTAGGFILPNDRVDVLSTISLASMSGAAQVQSRVILRNVRVLAIDQMVADGESDAVVGKTATLELNAAQVEAITAAEASGTISLALRALADNLETSEIDAIAEPRTVRIYRAGDLEIIRLSDPEAPADPAVMEGY